MGGVGGRKLTIALAGNANVGKSVIFNELTGLHRHVGNWPGKTVERAEGTLSFRGYTIDVLDLPGIYSLSTYSMEEMVSREYIAVEQPDVLVNVVDASILERNLFFTLQLLELEPRMVILLAARSGSIWMNWVIQSSSTTGSLPNSLSRRKGWSGSCRRIYLALSYLL